MAAAWQKWLPFYVNDYLASAKVQKMPLAARAMYFHLLLRSWESDDCTIPSDAQSLQELAGATNEEWTSHCGAILPSFKAIKRGRLRNERLYLEWNRARTVHENRRAATLDANRRRWHPEPVTESVTESVPDMHQSGKAVKSAANGAGTAAARLMELLGLASGKYDLDMVTQVIAFEAREAHTDPEEAAKFLLQAAQGAIERGEIVNTFWFKDRKFAQDGGSNGNGKGKRSAAKERVDNNRRALAEAALKRGWIKPPGDAGEGAEAMAEPGQGRVAGRAPGGLRTAEPEILAPEGRRGS